MWHSALLRKTWPAKCQVLALSSQLEMDTTNITAGIIITTTITKTTAIIIVVLIAISWHLHVFFDLHITSLSCIF